MYNYTTSQIIAYISVKCLGDWNRIYDFLSNRFPINYEEIDEVLSNIKTNYLTILDERYPQGLREMYKAPFVLFYIGDISLISDINKNIAVVGSRNMSRYGENSTKEFVKSLSKHLNIVSGLALGIDTVAHVQALDSGAKTIAVLPGGILNPYPLSHTNIYKRIIEEGGLVLSEYPNSIQAEQQNFPIRNRIIAGISHSIFVPEAHPMSGTLITVNLALNKGKEIFCLPNRIGTNSLCNELIRDGATLVQSPEDILHDIGIKK